MFTSSDLVELNLSLTFSKVHFQPFNAFPAFLSSNLLESFTRFGLKFFKDVWIALDQGFYA